MTSSIPNRRYGNALRRLGFGPEATHFYDEHVEADAVHENIAAWDLAGGLAADEPEVAADILFGARALLQVEARWAGHLMDPGSGGRPRCSRPWLRLPPEPGGAGGRAARPLLRRAGPLARRRAAAGAGRLPGRDRAPLRRG